MKKSWKQSINLKDNNMNMKKKIKKTSQKLDVYEFKIILVTKMSVVRTV